MSKRQSVICGTTVHCVVICSFYGPGVLHNHLCFSNMADDKDFMSKESSAGKRKYLKSYETLPAQLLNCYGEAKFARMSDESLWTYVYLIFADALSLFSRVSQSLLYVSFLYTAYA